jgi:predicted choloylglycine hydrolase
LASGRGRDNGDKEERLGSTSMSEDKYVEYPSVSYKEMGRIFGKEQIELSKITGWVFKIPNKDSILIAYKIEAMLKEIFPEILEEIKGIAEETGYEYPVVLANIVLCGSKEYLELKETCISIAVRSELGYILALNYEQWEELKVFRHFLRRKPISKLPSVSGMDCYIGASDGMNGAGLALTSLKVSDKICGIGISPQLLCRIALDSCESVDDFINLARRVPHLLQWNFLGSDGYRAVKVEVHGGRKLKVIEINDDLFVVGNYFEGQINSPSYKRAKKIYDFVKKRKLRNPEDLIDILGTHEGDICFHGSNSHPPVISSSVYWPAKRRAWIAFDRPCSTPFREISLL